MFKISIILLSILFASPLYARETRGPQQFTVTNPDGSMYTGQYVPDTGQVILQTPGGTTVMQHEPNNNWQISIQPPDRYEFGSRYDGNDD